MLREIIHPELILGRRGDPSLIKVLTDMMSSIKIVDYGVEASGEFAQTLLREPNLIKHLVACKTFKEKKGKVYYIGHDFSQALAEIDREIPVHLLPKQFFAYIALSKDAVQDESDSILGAYVCITTGRTLGSNEEESSEPTLLISYLTRPKDNLTRLEGLNGEASNLTVRLNKSSTLLEMMKAVPNHDSRFGFQMEPKGLDILEIRAKVFRLFVNAVLYIHSHEPDLELGIPITPLRSKTSIKKEGKVATESSIPVILIHRNFHKSRTHSIDSTTVRSHLRWQKCGPEFSLTRLVLVREHERHFEDVLRP